MLAASQCSAPSTFSGRPIGRSVDGRLEAERGYDRTRLGALDYERGGTAGIGKYCRGYE